MLLVKRQLRFIYLTFPVVSVTDIQSALTLQQAVTTSDKFSKKLSLNKAKSKKTTVEIRTKEIWQLILAV